MSDVVDAVTETIERSPDSRLHSVVAIMVALTATLMALGNVKDGNIVQAMQQAQARSVDTWAYYQSKSTKQHLAETMVSQVELQSLVVPAQGPVRARLDSLRAHWQREVVRYGAEKDSVQHAARDLEHEYDALNVHDDQFDLAEACFSIALATYGISALTRRRWLLVMGVALTLAGTLMTLAGFLGGSLHSDAFSRILG